MGVTSVAQCSPLLIEASSLGNHVVGESVVVWAAPVTEAALIVAPSSGLFTVAQSSVIGFSVPQTLNTQSLIATGMRGPKGDVALASISTDPGNRLTEGSDGKLYVSDDLNPDPLAYYILAKG